MVASIALDLDWRACAHLAQEALAVITAHFAHVRLLSVDQALGFLFD